MSKSHGKMALVMNEVGANRAQGIVAEIIRKQKEAERTDAHTARVDLRRVFQTMDVMYRDDEEPLPEESDGESVTSMASTQSLPAIFRSSYVRTPLAAGGPSPTRATRKAKAKLTSRSVPRGADSLAPYCSSCEFEDCRRCNFCQNSKVSNVHRMPLERFARALLTLRPALTPQAMGREIARYARSDRIAERLNEELGWGRRGARASFCDAHLKERAAFDELQSSAAVDRMQERLDQERRATAAAATEIERLKAALVVGDADDEFEAKRSRYLVSELEKARNLGLEQEQLILELRSQLDAVIERKVLHDVASNTTRVSTRCGRTQTSSDASRESGPSVASAMARARR